MARLRKAARTWRNPAAQTLARRVTVPDDGALFTIDPDTLFARPGPLEVECGAGKGEFIIERAASMPERNFLAIELAASVARLLAVRVGRTELTNLRVARADARAVVNLMLPDSCVAAYHIYFPDPWPKERHVKHRLFSAHFVSSLARTLEKRGRVFIATDVADYSRETFAMLEAGAFAPTGEPVPGAEHSSFARKYLAAGKPVFSRAFRLRP